MKTFSELSLSALLKSNLAKHGFVEPTPVQALSIEPALAGNNVVATAQTGTGKTLAFVLPLIHLLQNEPRKSGVRALILIPTRELAIQIQEVFTKLAAGTGIRSAVVVGGLGENPQLQAIRKGAQVVIATPGRMFDFLSRQLVNLSGSRILVLDEADRMLDMGFLPTIKRIIGSMPSDKQTLFFSATIETSVKHLVEVHVPNAVRVEVGNTTKPVEQVDLHVYEIEGDRKLGLLEKMLEEERGSFLVFARTKHGADRLARKLVRTTGKVVAIHGDRSQNQRNQALKGFQDGYYRVLVATDVAARGIHVDNISHVVNFDLPQVPEDFIHRVGRTGRAGARGVASTFATRNERSEITRIERALGVKMIRKDVPGSVQREAGMAPVIEIPMSSEPRPKKFVFKTRNVRRRRAV
ncbi:MAG TPA: DEAD/DEAH box helicase [Candidatus Sulfopaludibacter sp.]|jgi:ATP-dependent RNA helicase RhlE|nr:DEAD/DEAH box helicase [Candidatus Sulfopaludibacter sp.]